MSGAKLHPPSKAPCNGEVDGCTCAFSKSELRSTSRSPLKIDNTEYMSLAKRSSAKLIAIPATLKEASVGKLEAELERSELNSRADQVGIKNRIAEIWGFQRSLLTITNKPKTKIHPVLKPATFRSRNFSDFWGF